MIRLTLLLCLICCAVTSTAIRAAADGRPMPVKARMLADVSAVAPGEPFEIAVLLEIEPHWHVYWKNPGDSGLPTSVAFTLPEGYKASGLEWPVPGILKGAGDVTDYGYEGSLLLSARVTPPPGIEPGTVAKFTARVSWVSCRDICIPGRAELKLDMPVSKDAERVNAELFSEWRSRLPVNLTGGAPPFHTDLKTMPKGGDEYSVTISLDSNEDLKNVAIYPVPGNSYIVGDITVKEDGGKSIISFDVKEIKSNGAPEKTLDTLIVYAGKGVNKSGYEFRIPLHR